MGITIGVDTSCRANPVGFATYIVIP